VRASLHFQFHAFITNYITANGHGSATRDAAPCSKQNSKTTHATMMSHPLCILKLDKVTDFYSSKETLAFFLTQKSTSSKSVSIHLSVGRLFLSRQPANPESHG
jgi:hypothetical protein